MTSTVSGSVSEATWMSHGADRRRPGRRPYSAGRHRVQHGARTHTARPSSPAAALCPCRGFAGNGGRARRDSSGQGAVRLAG